MAEETAGVSNMHLISLMDQPLISSLVLPGAVCPMGKGSKPSSDINPADFCSTSSEINLAQAEHFKLSYLERIKDGAQILMET